MPRTRKSKATDFPEAILDHFAGPARRISQAEETITKRFRKAMMERMLGGLEPMYPVVFFHALRVKMRDEGTVRSKAVYLALAVLPDGSRDILGIWIEQTEGAKFWLKVFTDLKARGCHEIATWEVRKDLAAALRAIDTAPDADQAAAALDAFAGWQWGQRYPAVVASWRRAWVHVIPFFAFPPDVRTVLDTTNALASVHARLRKILKTQGPISDGRGRDETDLAGAAEYHGHLAQGRPNAGAAPAISSPSCMVNASRGIRLRDDSPYTQNF